MDTKQVREWYFNAIPPQLNQFIKFLSNAHELGHGNTTTYTPTPKKYVFPFAKETGVIPDWLFSEKAFEELPTNSDKRAVQTALWNHTILLNKYLVPNIYYARCTGFRKIDRQISPDSTLGEYVFRLNANERVCESSFKLFANTSNEFMFSIETLKYAVETENIGDILEHYHNPALRNDIAQILGNDVVSLLNKIRCCSTSHILRDHTIKLHDLLFPPEDKQEQEQENQNEEDNGGENGSQLAEWAEQHQSVEAHEQPFENVHTNHKIHDAIEELNNAMIPGWDKQSAFTALHVEDIMESSTGYNTIEESDVFANMGKLIRQIKVTKELPNDPQRIGSIVLEDELYRATIDRRIMGEYEEIKQPIKKEWRLVCDLSGSTAGKLLRKELQAAKGAFLSLRDAREDVAVYGHTTQATKGEILYKIAYPGSTTIDVRFNTAASVYNGSNYDNLIIEYIAAKEFNYPDSMKIIVMLSDGKPCGNTGVVDTQEIVYRLRKKGYIIFSVSLVSDVIEENNVIYGKTWNIDASCGNIDHKLRELFIKMATEYK